MIRFEHMSLRYSPDAPPVLADVNLELGEGRLVLVTGRTGSGKSTLLAAINGHVPHFTGGVLTGRVVVNGMDTAEHPPREFAEAVGVVSQDPMAGFVTETVEEELAYSMEQRGVPADQMRTRVEETLDILGMADLRTRSLRTLSGGQQQRAAIGSVLSGGARVLVLDEPTSALDPVSAEEVLATLLRLVHDLGLTVVIAEHRLERVVGYADDMVVVEPGGRVTAGPTPQMITTSPLLPPVAQLSSSVGWDPPCLTVRQARWLAPGLTDKLALLNPEDFPRAPVEPVQTTSVDSSGVVVRGASVVYGSVRAVDHVSLEIPPGEVTALMGRNGSGKSSLMWALTGLVPLASGTIEIDRGADAEQDPADLRDVVRLVPQSPGDLLYLPTVGEECQEADRFNQATSGTCAAILANLAPGISCTTHPRDLSEGQRLCLVLAIQLTSRPRVVLLDEPTRGLDYPAKESLVAVMRTMAARGSAVGVVTHDVEFAASVADRVVVMAQGEVIQAGPVADVLAGSALFSPQVAKVFHPARWLTPYQVQSALRSLNAASDEMLSDPPHPEATT